MMAKDQDPDPELGRLLSGRKQPSVLEKEAIFEGVWAQVRPQPARTRWPLWSLVSAASALLALFVVWPRTPEFQARGGESARLELRCEPTPCQAGGQLLFEVGATPEAPHFGAFSRRADGTVIWYAPSPEGKTSSDPRLAFRLESEHTPGEYQVYGLFTTRPMDREELKAALGEALSPSTEVQILKRALQVQP